MLRLATASDVPALVALVNSAYRGAESRLGWTTEADLLGGQRVDEEGLYGLIALPASGVLLWAAGDLLGCVHVQRAHHDEAYLGMLSVRPRLQRAGLGSTLLQAAETHARQVFSARSLRLTVIAQRSALIAWYERRGYRPTGQTEAFPYGQPRFGLPQRADLYFSVLQKSL
jgi:ribosomal protein S18 acetylase RimI-like enzyme